MIRIKDLNNSKDLKNWEMLKTDVNTIVKKEIHWIYNDIQKSTDFFKNQNNFLTLKSVPK